MKRFLSVRFLTLSRLRDLHKCARVYAFKWAYARRLKSNSKEKKEGSCDGGDDGRRGSFHM